MHNGQLLYACRTLHHVMDAKNNGRRHNWDLNIIMLTQLVKGQHKLSMNTLCVLYDGPYTTAL